MVDPAFDCRLTECHSWSAGIWCKHQRDEAQRWYSDPRHGQDKAGGHRAAQQGKAGQGSTGQGEAARAGQGRALGEGVKLSGEKGWWRGSKGSLSEGEVGLQ